MTTGGNNPTGVLGNEPRALACSLDGAYCYAVIKHSTSGISWVNTFGGVNPDTGESGTHYASTQIVRIRISDGYITHLTKIHWSTATQECHGVHDRNPNKRDVGCMLKPEHDKYGAQIHPITKRLIVNAYGRVLSMDVESLLTSCTTLGTFGALSYCAESEQPGFIYTLANTNGIDDLAITPNGRIFTIQGSYSYDTQHLYALSATSYPRSELEGGGEYYSVTQVAQLSTGIQVYTKRLLPWNNDKLILCAQHGTSATAYRSAWWYVDISDESLWPFEQSFVETGTANHVFQDNVNTDDHYAAFPNSMDGMA